MAVETHVSMIFFLIETDPNPKKAVLTVPLLVSVHGICAMTAVAQDSAYCVWRFDLCWAAN